MQPLQYELRCPAAKHNSITRTATGARNLYAAITLRFAAPRAHSCSHYIAFCSIRWLTRMYLRTWQQNMTTIMQPLHCDLQPEIQQGHRTTHTWTSTRCRTPRRNRFDLETTAAAPAAYTSCSSSPAAATLHGKTQGFVPRLPPQRESHATFMQRFQSVLQHHAHTHSCSHYYNAIGIHALQNTMGEPSARWNDPSRTRLTQELPCIAGCSHFTRKKHKVSCSGFLPNTSPMQHSCSHYNAFSSTTHTFMEPLQCDISIHTLHSTIEEPITRWNDPHPPHTGAALHRRLQPLYTEKHKVSCSGFLPNTSPMQHSCCISNAFCSSTHTCMQPLQCDWHPHVADHHGRTDYVLKRSKPHPPHTGCTFHRRLQPLYTDKHKVSCSGFLPNTSPMQPSCSHYNAFSSTTHTFMEPLQCDISIHTLHSTIEEPITRWNDPHPPHTGAALHRRLQPLYTEKRKVSCSGFLPNTSPMQHSCGHYNAFCSITSLSHHPSSSPLPFFTATLRHLPQSPPFIITTSPPFVTTTSLSHHWPQSPPFVITTSLHHHFPQWPPFVYVMYCCAFRTAVGAHGEERKTACQGAFMFISLIVGSVSWRYVPVS